MVDAILEEEPATLGSAAYLALTAADMMDEDASPGSAVQLAREAGWLSENADAGTPVTFGELAYLLMRAFDIQGGLMYRVIPGPRYAAREFVYQGWSPERKAPDDLVTGEFLIRLTGNFLDKTEVNR